MHDRPAPKHPKPMTAATGWPGQQHAHGARSAQRRRGRWRPARRSPVPASPARTRRLAGPRPAVRRSSLARMWRRRRRRTTRSWPGCRAGRRCSSRAAAPSPTRQQNGNRPRKTTPGIGRQVRDASRVADRSPLCGTTSRCWPGRTTSAHRAAQFGRQQGTGGYPPRPGTRRDQRSPWLAMRKPGRSGPGKRVTPGGAVARCIAGWWSTARLQMRRRAGR
jgi:hypothetical protein